MHLLKSAHVWPWLAALLVAVGVMVPAAAMAATVSGQVAFGQSTVEPAVNILDGSTVFLLTPNHVPFPSVSNPRASAPLYIPMYPKGSTINPASLNCQPHNCDHLNVLPFVPSGGPYPSGSVTTRLGTFTGGLVIGHDHLILVGPPPAGGDFNVAWHVILVVFTPQAVVDGAINRRITTLDQLNAVMANGDAFEADTPIVFNCSVVSATVYNNGTPLTF